MEAFPPGRPGAGYPRRGAQRLLDKHPADQTASCRINGSGGCGGSLRPAPGTTGTTSGLWASSHVSGRLMGVGIVVIIAACLGWVQQYIWYAGG